MSLETDLQNLIENLQALASQEYLGTLEAKAKEIIEVCDWAGEAHSKSWKGYHANVYFENFEPPPPGNRFSAEWGLSNDFINRENPGWFIASPSEVRSALLLNCGDFDVPHALGFIRSLIESLLEYQAELESILTVCSRRHSDSVIAKLIEEVRSLTPLDPNQIAIEWSPKGKFLTQETEVAYSPPQIPPHIRLRAEMAFIQRNLNFLKILRSSSKRLLSHIKRIGEPEMTSALGNVVFIGHGRSLIWRELKDYIKDDLKLDVDEFNRVSVAGKSNKERLLEMLDRASIGLIVLTAEDELADGTQQARMNCAHEVGLFQGRLGWERGVILLEEGCEQFGNIEGVGQIRFHKGDIKSCFHNVQRHLTELGLI